MDKTVVLLCLFLLATQQVCLCSTLYGISVQKQLEQIDPLSFNVTVVGSPQDIFPTSQAIRIDTPDYYLHWLAKSATSGVQLSIRPVNMWQDSYTTTTNLPLLSVSCFTLDYTTSNNVLVLGAVNIDKFNKTTMELGRVNPFGRTYVPIATYTYSYTPGPLLCEYDAFSQIFFVNNQGLNGVTGAVERHYAYTPNDLYLEALNWDPKTGLFFLFALNNEQRYPELISLDPKTGKVTIVSTIPGYWGSTETISALDPVSRTFYVLAIKLSNTDDQFLLSINIDTGKLISSVYACKYNINCPSSMNVLYDRSKV